MDSLRLSAFIPWGIGFIALIHIVAINLPLPIIITLALFLLILKLFWAKNLSFQHYNALLSLIIALLLSIIFIYSSQNAARISTGQVFDSDTFWVEALTDSKIDAHNNGFLLVKLKQSASIYAETASYGTLPFYFSNAPLVFKGANFKVEGALKISQKSGKPYLSGKIIESQPVTYPTQIFNVRAKLINALLALSQQKIRANAPLYMALLIGFRHQIEPLLEYFFLRSGLMHVMALSGAHLGVLISAILLIFRKNRFSAIFLPAILVLYLILNGFQSSLFRATLAVLLIEFTQFKYYHIRTIDLLGISYFIIILVSPSAALSHSLRLSYLAVLAIHTFYKPIYRALKKQIPYNFINQSVSISLAAQIFILPYCFIFFKQIYWFSVLNTLLVIPVLAVFMTANTLLLLLPSTELTFICADLLYKLTFKCLQVLASWPYYDGSW